MHRDNPQISVIVPAYNAEKYISETIHSVLKQSFHDFEVIVVDDCSTDSTADIVTGIADDRVRYLKNASNMGAGKTRNAGIEAARGRFIAFLDADDLWYPTKLEHQVAFMKSQKASVCYSRYDLIDATGRVFADSGQIPAQATYHQLLRHCFIRTSSLVYDVEGLGEKVYMDDIRKRQDFILFLNLLRLAGKAVLLDEITCSYRKHDESISHNPSKNISYQWQAYRKVEKLSLGYSLFLMANWFVRAGKVVISRRLALRRSAKAPLG